MKRQADFNEISDGRRYSSNDLVKADCADCRGCSECCRTVDTILLDPWDIYMLSSCLGSDFQTLLARGIIELNVHDGLILPNFSRDPASGKCRLLSSEGRCTVHDFRPGFCRLFPLGRIYDADGSFSYFLQVNDCPYPSKSKVRVSKWLGVNDLPRYEAYIRSWHSIEKNLTGTLAGSDEVRSRSINLGFLRLFYMTAYDTRKDFYIQFEERCRAFDPSFS